MKKEVFPDMPYEHLPTSIALHLSNFQRRRETQPVWHDEKTGTWHIYRYSDAARVLTEASNFGPAPCSDPYSSALRGIAPSPPIGARQSTVVRNIDFVRPFLSEALTPRVVSRMQPYIERTVGELLDTVLSAGKLEVMSQLARPLATSVLGEFVGIPAEDREQADISFEYFARLVSTASASDVADCHPGSGAGTEADLISRLLCIEVKGEHLTDDEVAASCFFCMKAARTTLSDTLGNMLLLLSLQPDALKRLRHRPPPLYSTVEEALRYLPAVWAVRRTVMTPASLGGQNLPEGADVCVWLVSANHDPKQFDHPERFDIDLIPNRHLTFGDDSTLSCLGGGLTRLVARLTLAAIAQRITRLEVAPGDAVAVGSPLEAGHPADPRQQGDSLEKPQPGEGKPAVRGVSDRCSLNRLDVVFDV